MSSLTVTLGSPDASKVLLQLISHSALNGTDFAAGSNFTITNNDPTVVSVPDSAPAPGSGGTLNLSVSVLGVGSADAHVTQTAADGTMFEGTATIVVLPTPTPGQVSLEVNFVVGP